jgi:hypothetical protein
LKKISLQDFMNFGMHHIAYIRPTMENDKTLYCIYAADGSRLSVMESFQDAMLATRLNDLEPVSVH